LFVYFTSPWFICTDRIIHVLLYLSAVFHYIVIIRHKFVHTLNVICVCGMLIFVVRQHSPDEVQYWHTNSVCPSVCHAPILYWKGLTYHHTFFSVCQCSHSSFSSTKHLVKFRRGHPLWGHRIQVRYINFVIFGQYVRYKTRLQLLWKGYKNSDALYRTMTFPMILWSLKVILVTCSLLSLGDTRYVGDS